MSITLDLPQELVSKLSAEAARIGLSLSEYVVHVLSTGRLAEQSLKTGEEIKKVIKKVKKDKLKEDGEI